MAAERNPFLPEPPADGEHQYGDSPSDLGGNHRCTLCGAYQGSPEGTAPCRGEYAESGKMRVWAAQKWREQLLQGDEPSRVWRVVELIARTKGARQVGGVLFTGSERWEALLDCGCRRELDYEDARDIRDGRVRRIACVAPSLCMMEAVRQHQQLNPGAEVQP